MMAGVSSSDHALDAYQMNRYSRQIGAYGVETMSKLVNIRVLIMGLGGVGSEIAKNLILAGPAEVALLDNAIVKTRDLGSNFFLREEDVGVKTRAAACEYMAQALNQLVLVRVKNHIEEDMLKSYTAIVLCDSSRSEAERWNLLCRKYGVKFFYTGIMGVMGFSFVDLGSSYTILDRTGESPVSRVISRFETDDLLAENEIIVRLLPPPDGQVHNIDDNDHEGWVSFMEVNGPLGSILNEKGPFRAHHVYDERKRAKDQKVEKIFCPYALRVVIDETGFSPELTGTGGVLKQVKVPQEKSHRPLLESIVQPVPKCEPGLLFTDGTKFGRGEQLHMALLGVLDYEAKNGHRPPANDDIAIDQVIQGALKINNEAKAHDENSETDAPLCVDTLEEDIVRKVARYANCTFQPLCAFFGGIVAQEIIKITGKYTPLDQWLHLDVFEVLPEVYVDDLTIIPSAQEKKPSGSRYDDFVCIFGKEMLNKLQSAHSFLVGSGALGCELLKNFALLGVGCSEMGLITVTDNDTIEISNLSRQFLFREHNVGQSKSHVACAAAVEMNPELRVKPLEHFVGPTTEGIFDEQFWESQTFIASALDNVPTRGYVDRCCVLYEKPFLDSGTMGAKCNVQVILPHMTSSYVDGPADDSSEASVPMCTLRNFPSKPEHCIEFARSKFDDFFKYDASAAVLYCENPTEWLSEIRSKTLDVSGRAGLRASAIAAEIGIVDRVLRIVTRLTSGRNSFEICIEDAFSLFHLYFRDKIDNLVATYPEDSRGKNGDLFWSGTKRFPRSVKFDVDNETHMQFVISTANLFAVNYGIVSADHELPLDHQWRNLDFVKAVIGDLQVPERVVEAVDMSGGGEDEAEDASTDINPSFEDLEGKFVTKLEELERLSSSFDLRKLQIQPIEFEKDSDSNFHIDFATSTTNLRAWNYRLDSISRHETKMTAGKIIPALATTTAAVTGLVMVELLKAIQPGKKIEAFRDCSSSLGINGYFFSEPSPPIREKDEFDPIELSEVKCKPTGFTKWDKTKIKQGSLTVKEFLLAFKEKTGLTITSLYHESANSEGNQGKSSFVYETTAWRKELKTFYDANLSRRLEDVVLDLYGDEVVKPTSAFIPLELSCEDAQENPYKVPQTIYFFK